MDIGRVGVEIVLVRLRDPGKTVLLARRRHPTGGDDVGLFEGFLRPRPGVHEVGGATAGNEIHGQHGELHGCAALDEQHLMVVVETEQVFHQGRRLLVHHVVFGRAVGGLHHRHPGSLPIGDLGLGPVERRWR